ncbi:MAG: site-2 protease family protein [Chamaesiphon sp.]
MNGTIRVGSLFGIPFYVHPSWFFILSLVTWSYGSGLASQFPGLGLAYPWLLGLMAALLLFASVLAHELGHSFVAISQGIEVKSINLFLFGGLANLEKESKTPSEAFWVAITGPLVSLILFGIFTAIGIGTGVSGPLAAIVGLLASINLALALFNLIPGLPLDGGNILKALIWKITGNPYKGVVFAGRVGQIFGWVAIISGLIPLLLFGSFGSFWNLFIGWFLLQNAGQAAQVAKVQNKLAGLTAEDAVTPNSPIVSEHLSLREFANDYIIGKPSWQRFFVTDEQGQLVGAIAVNDMNSIPTSRWTEVQVKELVQPYEFETTVKSNQSLLEVVTLLEQQQLLALPVIRDNGVFVGLVEKAAIINLL